MVSIFDLNFNVEVGGQASISKSVTFRMLLDFFKIVIPDSLSSFSVESYNVLKTYFFKQNYTKNAPGAQEKQKSIWQM
jgi:hypothetical protein